MRTNKILKFDSNTLTQTPFKFAQNELIQWDWSSLADAANVSYQTISNWHHGKVKSPHLRTITNVLNDMGYILVVSKK